MFGNRKGIEGGDDSSCYQTFSGPSEGYITVFFIFVNSRLVDSFYLTASTTLAKITE